MERIHKMVEIFNYLVFDLLFLNSRFNFYFFSPYFFISWYLKDY